MLTAAISSLPTASSSSQPAAAAAAAASQRPAAPRRRRRPNIGHQLGHPLGPSLFKLAPPPLGLSSQPVASTGRSEYRQERTNLFLIVRVWLPGQEIGWLERKRNVFLVAN